MTDENNQIKFFLYENWARTKTGQHTVQIAKHVEMTMFALVFGINMFAALLLQTILTSTVVDKRGLNLPVITQVNSYFKITIFKTCVLAPGCSKSGQLYPVDKSLSSGAIFLQLTRFNQFLQGHTLHYRYTLAFLIKKIVRLFIDFPTFSICWITAYPVGKVICPLNNWGLKDIFLYFCFLTGCSTTFVP